MQVHLNAALNRFVTCISPQCIATTHGRSLVKRIVDLLRTVSNEYVCLLCDDDKVRRNKPF